MNFSFPIFSELVRLFGPHPELGTTKDLVCGIKLKINKLLINVIYIVFQSLQYFQCNGPQYLNRKGWLAQMKIEKSLYC